MNLILAIIAGISILLILVLFLKVQAFLALLIAAMLTGLLAGMPPQQMLDSITIGMGSTLGFVATVVGLGALFGGLLEHCGGTQVIANKLLGSFGPKGAPLAMLIAGFIIAIPVFFDVAFIILVPIIFALQKQSGKSLLIYGLPLLAGLAITHSFIPPTPGPVAVADILGADLGWVILAGLLCGIPTALISGLFWGNYIGNKIHIPAPEEFLEETSVENPPSMTVLISIIGLPIILILLNTMSTAGFLPIYPELFQFLGHPFTALIIANLLAWYFLGIRRNATPDSLLTLSGKSLLPAGTIILLTGAGGSFKQVLIDTGAGQLIADTMSAWGMPLLLFGFIIAAIVRVLQGSATVAMITAAGVTASLGGDASQGLSAGLLVIAIASGATFLSHVNDSGFWLVNRYFNMTEKQTFQTWTIMTVLIGLTGFLSAWLIDFLF